MDEEMKETVHGVVGEIAKKMNRPMSWPVRVLKGYVRKELADMGFPIGETSPFKVIMNKKARDITMRWAGVLMQDDKEKQTAMAVAWIKEYLDKEDTEREENGE